MHPADIQAALKKAGSSQADIARSLSITETMVYAVVHGRGRSRRVATEIGRVVGLSVRRLWPDAYDATATARKAP